MTLTVPDLVPVTTLDEEVTKIKNIFESRNPGVLENESDYYTPALESFGEALYRHKVEVNYNFRQHFWMNAEGAALDYVASFFNEERLPGTRPYANFTFTLNEIKAIDAKIPADSLLGDANGNTAYVKNEVIIPAGQLSADGLVVLDDFIEQSEIKTEIILSTIPYLESVSQLENFHSGKAKESDDAFKDRISLSLETLSAAGPINAYKKRTLDADSRISSVEVYEEDSRIQICVATTEFDALLEQRIRDACTQQDDRPLNDKIDIIEAQKVPFSIIVKLSIVDGYSKSTAVSQASAALETLTNHPKIKEGVTLSAINAASMVGGVYDVEIIEPASSIDINQTQVFECESIEVSYV